MIFENVENSELVCDRGLVGRALYKAGGACIF